MMRGLSTSFPDACERWLDDTLIGDHGTWWMRSRSRDEHDFERGLGFRAESW